MVWIGLGLDWRERCPVGASDEQTSVQDKSSEPDTERERERGGGKTETETETEALVQQSAKSERDNGEINHITCTHGCRVVYRCCSSVSTGGVGRFDGHFDRLTAPPLAQKKKESATSS